MKKQQFGAGIWHFATYVDRYATDGYGEPRSVLDAIELAGRVKDLSVVDINYPYFGGSFTNEEIKSSLDKANFYDLGWKLSGDQGNQWIQEAVDLTILKGTKPTIRFNTTTGPSYTSDFCLDDFCFSSGGGCMPLPIELLNFDAKLVGDEVICNWSTATEINTDYFVIQRTTDGINFELFDPIIVEFKLPVLLEFYRFFFIRIQHLQIFFFNSFTT